MNPSDSVFHSIVNSQSELICRCQPDGRITFANKAFCDFYHLDPNNYQQLFCHEVYPEPRRTFFVNNMANIQFKYPSFAADNLVITDSGEKRWQRWTDTGLFDPQENLREVQSVGHNISNHELVELAAEQYGRELSALYTATSALLTTLDLEKLLGQILDAATSAIPSAEKGMLHLVARDTGQLETRALLGYPETDKRITQYSRPEHAEFVIKAVKTRRPQIIHDYQQPQSVDAGNNQQADGVRAVIVAPLILNDQVLGVLSLQSPDHSAFSDSDLRLLVNFATMATAAIRNAQLHAEVQRLAITDSLTGIFNRRGFDELAEREVERALRFKRPLSLLMLDIDHFKAINDTYGHAMGDSVLRTISEQCQNNTRKVDILGRFGGDEFAIMLPENDLQTAIFVAERIRKVLAATPIPTEQHLVYLSVSIGVVTVTPDITSLDQLMIRADLALYSAKQSGRNQVCTT